MLEYLPYVAAFVLLAGAGGVVYVARRINYWRLQGQKLQSDQEYVSPPANLARRLFRSLVSRIAQFLYLGPIKVKGKRPPARFKGLTLYFSNHQDEHDAMVVTRLLRWAKSRFFIAFNQCRGQRAPLVAFSGGIPVDFYNEIGSDSPSQNSFQPLDRPINARRVVKAVLVAVTALIKEIGTAFWIFPQGRLVRSNKLDRKEFHEGLLKIAREFKEATGLPVRFVPVAIHYDRSKKGRTFFHKLLNFFGYTSFRTFAELTTSRCHVRFGAPIAEETLPAGRKEATTVLYDNLVVLCDEQAKAYGPREEVVAA